VVRRVQGAAGVPIACETAGRGAPLVVVHGAGSARSGFDALRPHLEPAFAVTAVDRRGRGDSGDGREDYRLTLEFEDVAAVVRAAGHEALLFGHSFGGLVAAGAAGLLDALPKLVLYEPPMGSVLADEAWIERFETRLAAGDTAAAVREFMRDVGGYSDAEIDAMQDTPAWLGRLAAAPTVPRELRAERALALESLALERLEVPCLLLVGSESPAWARRSTEAYARALTDVRVHTLEGHAHGATVGAPERVAAELTRFLLD
jgi:pimeloyl-ACP methyl ester carboxylesterase